MGGRKRADAVQIVPTFGCSLEVWSAISALVSTVLSIDATRDPHTEALAKLERRLKYAEQHGT